ncbi:MAG TPA: hypothetical protein PKA58_30125, partial [Polyangium sp.]|nr:hypothetical protein [Polyangium sp.]
MSKSKSAIMFHPPRELKRAWRLIFELFRYFILYHGAMHAQRKKLISADQAAKILECSRTT